ncbi:MAG: zinc-dependent metalloprotease [Acidimicrobiia bacterium]
MADNPQPGDPNGDGDDNASTEPFLPAFLFDPSTFDFSQIDFSQMMRMLSSTGPVNWEVARQTAEWVALEGRPEPPIDVADRKQFEELVHAAQTLVVAETGLYATFATSIQTVGPQGWVDLHLVALRPVLEALATTLGDAMRSAGDVPESDEDLSAMFPGLPPGLPLGDVLRMVAPALLGVQAGSMIGYLAQHAFGRYDLPLPTGALPDGDEPSLCFVVPNVDGFEEEWTLPRDDLRFYLALHEVVHAAERSVPWVRARLLRLAVDYVSSYEIDPAAFEAEFGTIDPSDPASFESMTASPERILGAMQSPRQAAPREELQRLTAVIEGYADNVTERVGRRLVPTFERIHEAMLRHRVERGEAERFIEGLLGLKLERAHYELGQAFCEGVVERAGVEGLNRLWESESMLPTPNELEAPGLWLARINLPE